MEPSLSLSGRASRDAWPDVDGSLRFHRCNGVRFHDAAQCPHWPGQSRKLPGGSRPIAGVAWIVHPGGSVNDEVIEHELPDGPSKPDTGHRRVSDPCFHRRDAGPPRQVRRDYRSHALVEAADGRWKVRCPQHRDIHRSQSGPAGSAQARRLRLAIRAWDSGHAQARHFPFLRLRQAVSEMGNREQVSGKPVGRDTCDRPTTLAVSLNLRYRERQASRSRGKEEGSALVDQVRSSITNGPPL